MRALSPDNGLVVDPFIGFGSIARECMLANRRFLGTDLNPVAVRLSNFLLSPPSSADVQQAIQQVSRSAQAEIEQTYRTTADQTATHFLWEGPSLLEIWTKGAKGKRETHEPTDFDHSQCAKYADYQLTRARPLQIAHNSRINANRDLSWDSLFTGRARHNIDYLLSAIDDCSTDLQEALRVALSAAVGQMSRMVFTITRRGKNTGRENDRIEVGSWAIGFWRPEKHFEVNVWNCFANRANKIAKALRDTENQHLTVNHGSPSEVAAGTANVAIRNDDAVTNLGALPRESADLILTDPPHGDRIPYLELSEIWNSLLGEIPDFEREAVVSNSPDRVKGLTQYVQYMRNFFDAASHCLKSDGILAVMFNATADKYWESFSPESSTTGLHYVGCLPMRYSAGSLVQDNRGGSLKNDYVLIYTRPNAPEHTLRRIQDLCTLSGWSTEFPRVASEK